MFSQFSFPFIDYSGVNMEDGALIGMHGLLLPACNMGEECILGALSLAGEGQSFEVTCLTFFVISRLLSKILTESHGLLP